MIHFVRISKDNSLNFVIAVPRHLTQKALEIAHDQSGHFGQFKSIHKAENNFYWPSLRVDVIKYLKECLSCQQFKHSKGLSQQFKELPIVDQLLQRIAIDLTDLISGQDGQRYIQWVLDLRYLLVPENPAVTRNNVTWVHYNMGR